MKQEINFLNSLPKEPRYLPAALIGCLVIVLAFILTIISLNQSIHRYQLSQQLKQAHSKHVEAVVAFQKVAAVYPMFAMDKPLVEQVSAYEETLRKKQERFAELTHATLRKPFSHYLKLFSLAVPEELWLSEIHIDQDSSDISLIGYSLDPVSVSLFIYKLQLAPVFKDVFFDLFYVKKIEDKNYIQFEIANNTLISQEETQKKKEAGKSATVKSK
ncbi:PilN domain-containing protein [Legionella oakridgensis]|uniref:Fimbrial assembly protein (PilN) n=1 Tax=Legionella oakridgensis TaxID=29423 RepID=A0A0W0X2Y8_9GAMM|nr:PilN domain-containing protein [Legionella oakridgensis]KTD38949.1 hypothetical protein Loak_1070 [Legionella oakridgensis]STY21323.1 Uncharacterised protein [Legionella longbeachae]